MTASSGNHGLAVAYISKKLGIQATIIVPTTAITAKVEAIEEQGATIIRCGIRGREWIVKTLDIATQTDATFTHSTIPKS